MLKTGISILALLYCSLCQAQCDSINYSSANRFNLKLSYSSSLIYPGMSTGIEYSLNQINERVLKNQKLVRNFKKERFISGNLSVIKLAGYNYALFTIGGGFGYDFSMVKHLPFSTVAKLNIISMFPYNSTIYFRPVFEFGIRYSPGWSKNNIKKELVSISK